MCRKSKYGENAYLTLEAALVLPLVMGIILFLIYLGFFQYDRCLLEQDVGSLALKGCSFVQEDQEKLAEELGRAAAELYLEKYIAWELSELAIELSGNGVSAWGSGRITFPFAYLLTEELGGAWHARARYENVRRDPVNFIRLYTKIVAGGE